MMKTMMHGNHMLKTQLNLLYSTPLAVVVKVMAMVNSLID